MKKIAVLFLTLALLCALFTGCTQLFGGENPNENNEELITDTINSFADACAEGKLDEAVDFLSFKSRIVMKALLKVADSVTGEYADFDLDEVFSGASSINVKEFISPEIVSIDVAENKMSAVAIVRIDVTGTDESISLRVKMVFEKDAWYIDDIAEHTATDETVDTEGESTEGNEDAVPAA